jgi:hypothetical protein
MTVPIMSTIPTIKRNEIPRPSMEVCSVVDAHHLVDPAAAEAALEDFEVAAGVVDVVDWHFEFAVECDVRTVVGAGGC